MKKIILLILLPQFIFSQAIKQDLDSILNKIFANDKPGGVFLWVENDSIIYQNCIGVSDLNSNKPLTPLSNFRMASVTKQFTAMAILLLEQQGKLSFDDPIIRFFPDFKPLGTRVTIAQLLTHSSGVIDYESVMSDTLTQQLTDEDVLNMIKNSTSLYFEGGKNFRYSNSGYCLLALIVEQVSGLSFPVFLRQNIFKPLGMKTTQVFDNKGVIKNRAYGFSFNKKKELIPSDQSLTSATKGDGGIYTSLHDYMLWDKALNDNKLVDLKTIFKKLYADLPDKNGKYSAGWFFNENTEGGLMMFHSGSTCGFSNIVIRVPEKKLLLLFFSNIADNHEAFKPIFNYLKQKNVIKTEIWKWHAATN